jgi:hypothetical protein
MSLQPFPADATNETAGAVPDLDAPEWATIENGAVGLALDGLGGAVGLADPTASPDAAPDTEAAELRATLLTENDRLRWDQQQPNSPQAREAELYPGLIRTYIREKLGPLPWVRRLFPCTVTAINTAERTCTVVFAERETPLAGCAYYEGTPQVGKPYVLRWPARLPDDYTISAEPRLYGRPWIKVEGGLRYLYRKHGGETVLYRYDWPPPVVETEDEAAWVITVVQEALSTTWTLAGSSTAAGEHTQIVLQSFDGPPWWPEGLGEVGPAYGTSARYHHLDAMGFEPEVKTYEVTPPWVGTIDAIANDGLATVGGHDYMAYDTTPGEQYPNLVTEDPPVAVCIQGEPDMVEPHDHGETWDAGTLGVFGSYWPITYDWRVVTHPGTNALYMVIDGETRLVLACPGFSSQPVGPIPFALNLGGAWEYDGQVARAWYWHQSQPYYEIPDRPWESNRVEHSAWLLGQGCTPNMPTQPPPVGSGSDPWGTPIVPDAVGIALDPETRRVILWIWAEEGSSHQIWKWTAGDGAWTNTGVDWLLALSRDGLDALAWRFTAPNTWDLVFTQDGGATWQRTAPPANTAPGGPDLEPVMFVDEVA